MSPDPRTLARIMPRIVYTAERLKAGIEVERPIALGVLKIKAKLGEMMPAGKGGRGKTSTSNGAGFDPKTVTAYRKLAANRSRLEDYYESSEDVPTQTDFIRFCGADGNTKSILVEIDSPGRLMEPVIPLQRNGQSPVVSGGPSKQRVAAARGDVYSPAHRQASPNQVDAILS